MSKIISRTDPLVDFKKEINDEMEIQVEIFSERVNTFIEEKFTLAFDEVKEAIEELQQEVQLLKGVNDALMQENMRLRQHVQI